MEGNTVLKLYNNFVDTLSKTSDITLVKFIYESDIFGNYDVTFRIKKTEITFNCDRNFLSVNISVGKNQKSDYFKILTKTLNVQQYDCNAIQEDKRLSEALKKVSETICELLNALNQR